jgi:DNA-binding CsgD family transcriptional regulator
VHLGAIIVDADARVLRANMAAEAIAAAVNAIRLRLAHGCAHGRLVLTACHSEENSQLQHLIRKTALGGASGGAMRTWNHSRTHAVAVLVSPLPRRLWGGEAGLLGRVPGRALVLLKDLSAARMPPPIRLLRELFGLTANEAEVARALYGGVTKEAVAAARGVRASTVKTQVDAILAKTGATNLRDLERLLGAL